MLRNLEIEEKSALTKHEYDLLINHYKLTNKIFVQDNYYFDTDNLDLLNQLITLRIRVKENKIKLTLKRNVNKTSFETHLIINQEQFDLLCNHSFNTSSYFDDFNYNVKYLAKLTTSRATIKYRGGTIFFDKSNYNNITDYEVEYEHDDFNLCKIHLTDFLKFHKIKYQPIAKKSFRALTSSK